MSTNGTIRLPGIATPDTPSSGEYRVYVGSDGKVKRINSAGTVESLLTESNDATVKTFGITVDGGGTALTTGVKGYVQVPYTGTIQSWTLLADQSGSVVIDIWKDTYANYPPTVADTITAAAKPTLSSATKNTDSTLTGWTTAVTAGDVFGFNIDSATTVTRVTLIVKMVVA